jgi:exodeoxyribonuclease X
MDAFPAPASPRRLRVVDLETTGRSFSDGGVVEVGWQDLVLDGGDGWVLSGPPSSMLINPGQRISPETSAIHHIVDEDVAEAPLWHLAAPKILRPDRPVRPAALAAHRATFEQRWCFTALTRGTPWICTYKCALRLWPDAPTHSNQGLRYWRRPDGLDRTMSLPAHRAGPDAYVTAHHLRDMLLLASLEQLVAWSAEPALLPRVPFGAHRGRFWRDLDETALEKIIGGQSGNDVDLLFSARAERDRRNGAGPAQPAQPVLML